MKKYLLIGISSLVVIFFVVMAFIGVSVDFAFSHPEGITLHPGSDAVYEFTLKNNSIFAKTVTISDPSDPLFTEGAIEKKIKVDGGKTEKITYSFKTKDDTTLVGNIIHGRTIKVGRKEFKVPETYIERTFNEWDARKIRLAILALESAPVENAPMLKWIYYVALSKTATLTGEPYEVLNRIFDPEKAVTESDEHKASIDEVTPEASSTIQMVVPRLYYSEHIADNAKALLRGEPLKLKDANFVTGDVFVTDEKMYIFDGEKFWEMKKNGMVKASVEKIKKGTYSRWAVLRPSMVIKNINYSTPYSMEGFTEKQKAMVITAEAFLLRGMRIQYADTRMFPNGTFRWLRRLPAETYTTQETGYTQCAGFGIEVATQAIGYKTNELWAKDIIKNEGMCPFSYTPTYQETDEEKAQIEKEFFNTLLPGDIISIIRKNGLGHVMLYIGCGDIIHSTGGVYNYEKGIETYEPTVRFMRAIDLFRKETYPTSYVFSELTNLSILRITDKEGIEITEQTQNRMNNMRGIVAEKTASHTKADTVNIGDEITYTVSVFNANKDEKTLEVKFETQENTTLLKGEPLQSITVPSEERVQVEFKIRVDGGDTVSGVGTTVGGVKLPSPDIKIANTLTKEEQDKIKTLIENIKNTEGNAIERANAIYEKLLGKKITEETETEKLRKEFFFFDKSNMLSVKKSSSLARALIPTIYGGKKLSSPTFDEKRTRLLKKEHFTIGDLLYVGDNGEYKLYIWSGDSLVDLDTAEKVENLDTFLEGILAVDEFFLGIRPSIVK